MKNSIYLAFGLLCVSCTNQGSIGNKTFKSLDKSGDFTLTTAEFVTHLNHKTFAALDQNEDGVVSKEEWSQPGATRSAAHIFALFDANKNGSVDLVEFLSMKKTPSKIGAHMKPFDKDNSGNLSWDELKD